MTTTTIPASSFVAIQQMPEGIAKLLKMKGTIATLKTEKSCKTRKTAGDISVTKVSTFQCRIGVNYDNVAAVKEKRENGELPAENAGLPWGRFVDGLFPYVIEHNGTFYFRCTTVNNNYIPEVHYFKNAVEISKDEAKLLCLASEFYDKEGDCFNVKVNNILEVNGLPF
jgi:hypothetical protein